MFIYLVRHGQTDWNNERRMQGHKNIPMNEVGIQQINDLADRIVETGLRFDRLISSPLDRARKSAEIIAEKTGFNGDIEIDDDFIERSNGLLEGEVWTPDLDFDDPKYKIESIPDLCKRAERALEKYSFGKDDTFHYYDVPRIGYAGVELLIERGEVVAINTGWYMAGSREVVWGV